MEEVYPGIETDQIFKLVTMPHHHVIISICNKHQLIASQAIQLPYSSGHDSFVSHACELILKGCGLYTSVFLFAILQLKLVKNYYKIWLPNIIIYCSLF